MCGEDRIGRKPEPRLMQAPSHAASSAPVPMGPLFVPAGKIQSERDAAGRKSLPAEVQLVDLFACDYYRGAKLGGQEPTASEGLRRGSDTADNGFMRHTILYNPKVLRIILDMRKERLRVVCARREGRPSTRLIRPCLHSPALPPGRTVSCGCA